MARVDAGEREIKCLDTSLSRKRGGNREVERALKHRRRFNLTFTDIKFAARIMLHRILSLSPD